MKYKDNRNLWDYIPYIVIAVSVFTIIWWAIVLNASADTVPWKVAVCNQASTNDTYPLRKTIMGSRVCALRTGSGPQQYDYNFYSEYADSYTGTITYNSGATDTFSVWPRSASGTADGVYYQSGAYIYAVSVTGIPVFTTIEQVNAYVLNGTEEGNLNHVAENIYNSEIPVPTGYYGQHTGMPLVGSYLDLYKNQIILTNYDITYKVHVETRWKYATDIKVQRAGSMSPYVNAWHDGVGYSAWYVQKGFTDNYVPDISNNATTVSFTIASEDSALHSTSMLENYLNYDVNGNINSSNLFPLLKTQIGGYTNNAVDDCMWAWHVCEYAISYYKVAENGDRIYGDVATFTVDMPYSLQWNILDSHFVNKMPDGYGATYGTVTGNNQTSIYTGSLGGITYNATSGSVTSGGTFDFSNAFSNSNQSLTSLSSSFNEISTFVGSVPTVMSAWFGFMPSWIWLLIALEFGFLIIFGLVKKVVG